MKNETINLISRKYTVGRPTIFVVLILALLVSSIVSTSAQASLEGKIVDAATGEVLIFATVALYKDGVLSNGVETDIDGKYYLSNIEAGTYDVEASHLGYTPKKTVGVILKDGSTSRLDFSISEGVLMDAIEVVEYKVPLVQIDNTTSGAVIAVGPIRSMPSKSNNRIKSPATGSRIDNSVVSPSKEVSANTSSQYVDDVVSSSLNEEYNEIIENIPTSPLHEPVSTFSIDVDRASYSNIRRFVNDGEMPPKDAVRIEEMVNYFNYNYTAPTDRRRPFKAYTELTECPWNDEAQLLHVGVQGKKIETKDLPYSNLVFLVDVSGSMGSQNKLPLVKESLKLLVEALREEDRIAIVTYAGRAAVVLPSTSMANQSTILNAIESLGTGGGTAGAQGIETAYDIARKNFLQDGNNRVILATDGDFNIGASSQSDLDKLIEKERVSGVFLSVLGYGMGNYKDGRMQSLANKGNGNHNYIDGLDEAKKVLVDEVGATLHTIAKDVKIQIEFNPAYVGSYRLIGYENRMLEARDFNDDHKDAGELGAGHSVTALYEIYPSTADFVDEDDHLKYQNRGKSFDMNGELGTVKLRYKRPGGHRSKLISELISSNVTSLDKVQDRTRHAAAIAEFGMLLRDSAYRGTASYAHVKEVLASVSPDKYLSKEAGDLVDLVIQLESPAEE